MKKNLLKLIIVTLAIPFSGCNQQPKIETEKPNGYWIEVNSVGK
ncbi:MAG: hypothetical protein ABIQ27_02290 [Flavobacterium sp.]